jgi:hypothetical protein
MPEIDQHLRNHGRRLFCCNSQSYLVTRNLCSFRPLIDCLNG